MRHCPARAIRVVDHRSEVIEDRCVKCGLCVTDCGNGSHQVRDDLPAVRSLLESGRPVVALLATEHIAAMHPLSPAQVEARLGELGFVAIESTTIGEELVAASYEMAHARSDSLLPQLRSTCPVVVEWVRRFYPQLTGALAPIVPPYVAQARLVRELYAEDTAIVYVSPCWARKDEVYDVDLDGEIDAAIGFDELRRLVAEAPDPEQPPSLGRRPSPAKQISVTDGFPRRTLKERDLTNRDVVVVRGLRDLDHLLAAISRGETAPAVVDMLNCDGCIDGPCVNRELSVYMKRQVDASERERQPLPAVDSRAFLAALPAVDLHRRFTARPAIHAAPTAEEIDSVLAAGEFLSRAETVDCGACGYATCVRHAISIWEGNSSWDMCFPLQRKVLLREQAALSEAATTDELTGLLNRRAFDQRLPEEVARAERYDTPLSLLMFDLDGFKTVNDQHGHGCGDALLRAVGVLLKAELRGTDIPVRYGGDEFAVILPNTAKTDAWAVAEKLRSALASLRIANDTGPCVTTSASVGVASRGSSAGHPHDLLAAADGALYRAKNAGRNRVELAAG